MNNQFGKKEMPTGGKCAVYVAVTLFPRHYSEGPTRNTVYPASWKVCCLPENSDRDDAVVDFIERQAASFVESCSGAKIVGWKKNEQQVGGGAYDAQFSAVCVNPFKVNDTWHVNAWLKKLQSDTIEEDLRLLQCGI